MFVANAIQGDSRVIKTAATLSKLGFRVNLFGMSKTDKDETLAGYPFTVELVGNPTYMMKAKRLWADAEGKRNIKLFIDLLAKKIADRMGGRRFDILHTHDMYGLPIGSILKELVIPNVAWIHDVHEHVEGCTNIDEHIRTAMWELEQVHIRKPDALTTVSPILAKLLAKKYGVPEPGLVLNAPRMADFDLWYPNRIRKALGLDPKTPLLVYNGNVKPVRGVHFAVEALGFLPEVNLALVTNSKGHYLDELLNIAERCKALDRFHIHPYVPNCEVTSFLQHVNAGINPVTLYENSDLALPNKIFEYIHSGTPIVSTATNALSSFLECNHCGMTFPEGDVKAFADAVQWVLKYYPDGLPNVAQGSQLAATYSWEAQENVIEEIYENLLGQIKRTTPNQIHKQIDPIIHLPVFGANQPGTLSKALKQIGCDASSASLGINRYGYDCDYEINPENHVLASINPYFVGSNIGAYQTYHFHARPLIYCGDFSFPTGIDLTLLKAMGKSVFFHFRGSEMRLNSIFKAATPYNYVEDQHTWTDIKKPYVFDENQQTAFRDFICGVCDDVFVNDPELQNYVPNALIVPRAIDWNFFTPQPSESNRLVPLIVHAPSRRGVKGTDYVLKAVEQLQKEGYKFEFKLVENMSHQEAMSIYRDATIIVDQLRIGWYGVLAVEGMALGKAVVSYIRNDLRHYLPYPSPLAMANPENITDVLRHLLESPDAVVRYVKAGRKFAQEYHQAHHIAEVLMDIYSRPFRPIDPVAVSVFLDHQTSHLKSNRIFKKALNISFKGYLKPGLYYSKAVYYFRKFLYVAKHQGWKEAVCKAFNSILHSR